jgi:hypothetical protein
MTFSMDFGRDKPRDPEELEIALARIAAHIAFDWLWQKGPYSRRGAYKWLAKMLGKTAEETHMKKFDAPTCRLVVLLAEQQRKFLETR